MGEIGGFVKKLGEKQGLELHSNLAERCLETTRGGAGASADDNSAFMRGLEVERMCVEGRDLDKILEHLRNLVHTSGDDPRRTARLLAASRGQVCHVLKLAHRFDGRLPPRMCSV